MLLKDGLAMPYLATSILYLALTLAMARVPVQKKSKELCVYDGSALLTSLTDELTRKEILNLGRSLKWLCLGVSGKQAYSSSYILIQNTKAFKFNLFHMSIPVTCKGYMEKSNVVYPTIII